VGDADDGATGSPQDAQKRLAAGMGLPQFAQVLATAIAGA